jgi:hypothetical protein
VGVGAVEALEPNVHHHADKFQKVVYFSVAKDWAVTRYADSPRSARQAVAANPKGTSVRPANSGQAANDDQIDGYTKGGFEQEGFPQFQVFDFIMAKFDASFAESSSVDQVSKRAKEVPCQRDDCRGVIETTHKGVDVILRASSTVDAVINIGLPGIIFVRWESDQEQVGVNQPPQNYLPFIRRPLCGELGDRQNVLSLDGLGAVSGVRAAGGKHCEGDCVGRSFEVGWRVQEYAD